VKCLVLGAGAQGAAATAILARADDVDSVLLADRDQGLAAGVRARLGADPRSDAAKLSVAAVDARNVDEVARLAAGRDVIVNFVHMDFSSAVRAAALAAGTHYVDSASDLQWQHDIAFEGRVNDDEAFKAAGLTALSGSGDTPGVANALSRYAADMLDEIDGLVIRLGYGALGGGPAPVYFGFDPGWSPEVALQDFHDKACVFTGGRATMQGPFANPEIFRFPDPIGEMVICSHSHDESYTLPFFVGKGIKECDFKYAVDQAAGTLVAMGFGDPSRVIELADGTNVRPFDVAMALTPRPGERTVVTEAELDDLPAWRASMLITASGRAGGHAKRVVVHRPYGLTPEVRRDYLATLGTVDPFVAAPAVAGARLVTRGATPPGVMAVEALDPLPYLREVDALIPLTVEVEVSSPLVL
jgi:saccharopine dehydrogenase-like NADP-dependent oxidoreductase